MQAADQCEEELINQAASLEDAKKEERKWRGPATIGNIDTACTGQLIVRYINPADKKNVFKTVSGTIVTKTIDDDYILLTARTNMQYFVGEENEEKKMLDCEDGFFFLQKTDKKSCKAIFNFKKEDVKHYMAEIEFKLDEDTHVNGRNLSGIRLTNVKVPKDLEIPDLACIDNDDFAEDTQFTVAGYPEQVLVKKGEIFEPKNIRDKMYSVTGICQYQSSDVLGLNILTSKGQNGGAITFTDSGRVFGIYTDIVDHKDWEGKFGMAIKMTKEIVETFVESI